MTRCEKIGMWILLALATLAPAACGKSSSQTDPETSPTCTVSADCPSGESCVDGACTPDRLCQTDTDCDSGMGCENGRCAALTACMDTTDCPVGSRCVMHYCRVLPTKTCTDGSLVCPSGTHCDTNSGSCVSDPPDGDTNESEADTLDEEKPCVDDEDCAEGQVCVLGDCQAETPGDMDETEAADTRDADSSEEEMPVDFGKLCQACTSHAECGGSRNLCLADQSGATYCARFCNASTPCPEGYSCLAVIDSTVGDQCLPKTSLCPGSITDGDTTSCEGSCDLATPGVCEGEEDICTCVTGQKRVVPCTKVCADLGFTISTGCESDGTGEGSCQCSGQTTFCPGYTGGDTCCGTSNPCSRAGNGTCECGGNCSWDSADCSAASDGDLDNDAVDNDTTDQDTIDTDTVDGDTTDTDTADTDTTDTDTTDNDSDTPICTGYDGHFTTCCRTGGPCGDWVQDGYCDCSGLCAWDQADCTGAPGSCGRPRPITVVPFSHTGVTTSGSSTFSLAGCEKAGLSSGPEQVYQIEAVGGHTYEFSVEANWDVVLSVRTDCADNTGSCFAVDDTVLAGETLTIDLTSDGVGYLSVVVDGYSSSDYGTYTLTVTDVTE